MMNFKDIHIGQLIEEKVKENSVETSRISNFMKLTPNEIKDVFEAKDILAGELLRWCKLLEYDFMRIYSQHLILYAPVAAKEKTKNSKESSIPQFRKNIYTKEIIDFILERIETKEMTINEIINKYKIPKTTLYKWINKYKK